ncbi:MAG: sigma-54 dependent transcriptional regulator [Planctomycetes bacterium]|nr:sigma-54 dependent transcriptional regulator [Planctomycetota bacterium]MCC7399281.1 sigma-54-dependent Fis family transcriptional regulator [Planctomycetota bacterium]
MAKARVLVVDDERDLVESCVWFLERAGYEARGAASADEAMQLLAAADFQVVVSDVRMPRMSGMELLAAIKARDPDVEVLLLTGFPDLQMAVAAIKQGAFDYLAKPYAEKDLLERVAKAAAHRRVKDGNAGLRERLRSGVAGRRLIHRSAGFGDLVTMLERAARTDASVLLLGESGTGKELLAHHLHDKSVRADKPFVPVDCASIPTELFESELFGHMKGAFTGAGSQKLGLIQVADGGTLFLDELGELPLAFQAKLLRAIQERCVRPVGGSEQVPVDVRIVAATNRNLQKEVDDGRFRADLFYRLDVVRIAVPPLRDRPGDVDVLVEHFLERFGRPVGIERLSAAAAAVLREHHWPGNVRQLRNAIERACALGHPPELQVTDLPPELLADQAAEPAADAEAAGGTFAAMKARRIAVMESSYVESLLKKHKGNVTHCSEEAGMARSAFQKLMQKYGIRSAGYRD